MHYVERTPSAPLKPFINCFWMIHADRPGSFRDRTYPDGCQELVFSIDSTVERSDDGGKHYSVNPPVELIGQMTRPYDIVTHGRQMYFGVKFFPHSFSAFTDLAVHELRDQSISPREVLRSDIVESVTQVFTQPSFERFVIEMERYFTEALSRHAPLSRSYLAVHHAVKVLLQNRGAVRLDTLPDDLGMSRRYVLNAFRQHVGLSPKQLASMLRFQSTFQYLHKLDEPLTNVALDCGYYDHAHFAHDFRRFSGESPSSYRATDNPLNRFFLNETSQAYLCNTQRQSSP